MKLANNKGAKVCFVGNRARVRRGVLSSREETLWLPTACIRNFLTIISSRREVEIEQHFSPVTCRAHIARICVKLFHTVLVIWGGGVILLQKKDAGYSWRQEIVSDARIPARLRQELIILFSGSDEIVGCGS